MRRGLAALMACVLAVAPSYAADVYRFGRLGEQLPADDLNAVTLAVADQGAPWAVLGWYSMVLPEVRYIDLFMEPTLSTPRLRRGPFVHLECSPNGREVSCLKWARTGQGGAYAQVAVGPEQFAKDSGVRQMLERPFRVHGAFSDEELLSLVLYIRTAPKPPTKRGWTTLGISGGEPIQDIHREADGSARVVMTSDGYVFEVATCVRSGKAWRITSMVHGIA